ncbi:hypothetical protein ASG25_20630 [Rhizobium sp. Leaf384]|uniref:Crp/Fnr family transcriptional regulator n=1 Tax=Rhizobium sp. Leaf384 TaxID=1736358 RepID=UPI0007130EDE|nr:Crp/Fnr family transcriptional regulator [Rhizobium sp. Leaf384]KQS75168.1 hypothetical protein ASG25_20630 [Rhizobium sp. Leaf384]
MFKVQELQANGILQRLPEAELAKLLPRLAHVHLDVGTQLETAFEPVKDVYFPLSFIASVVASSPTGNRIETGLIGPEGFTGTGLSFGDRQSPYELVVQMTGSSLVLSADSFLEVRETCPVLGRMAMHFARSLSIQVSFTALANGRYTIQQRLARWLLMLQDRSKGNDIAITHAYLSVMLGVRRSGITEAIHLLEGDHLIRSTRGNIVVLDRQALLRLADDAYGVPETEYHRLMGTL